MVFVIFFRTRFFLSGVRGKDDGVHAVAETTGATTTAEVAAAAALVAGVVGAGGEEAVMFLYHGVLCRGCRQECQGRSKKKYEKREQTMERGKVAS